jgi:hypothetical protein
MAYQDVGRFSATFEPRPCQRSVSVVIRDLEIGACPDQHIDHVRMTLHSGPTKRGFSAAVVRVQFGMVCNEQTRDVLMSPIGRLDERAEAVSIGRVDVRARRNKQPSRFT